MDSSKPGALRKVRFLTPTVRELLRQKRNEAFSVWVDALRLRGAMKRLELERITETEWNEYDRPTAGVFNYEQSESGKRCSRVHC